MGFIRNVQLATSQPVNLATGFPFFPLSPSQNTIDNPLRPQRIGIDGSAAIPRVILNVNIPVLLYRLRTQVTARFVAAAFFGYNLQYTVNGSTSSAGFGDLRFTDDSASGGLGVGMGFEIDIALAVDQAAINFTWRSGFQRTWSEIFSRTGRANIDLIRIALGLLQSSGFNIPLDAIDEVRDASGSRTIWGLFDTASNQLGQTGELVIRPRVSIHGNVLTAIPQLSGFLKALKNVGAKVTAGPQLNLTFPVTISIVRLTTEDGDYDFSGFSSNTGVFGFRGPTIQFEFVDLQEVTVTHSHSVGIALTFELKAKLKLWSIFSESISVPIDISPVLPFPLSLNLSGPTFAALSNQTVASAELPEVVWG
jgi:hypothetical protein